MTLLMLLHALLDVLLPRDCPACFGPCGLGWTHGLCRACRPPGPLLPRWVEAPAPIALAFTLGPYAGPLGALVRRGKYRPDPGAMSALGHQMAAAGRRRLPTVDAVCPVPVPPLRRLQRGFNQAELLSIPVAHALGVPVVRILRRRHGARQAGRSGRERRRAAQAAFRCSDHAPARVLLVDDVLTTGSTAAACATELLGAGARRVYLFSATQAGRLQPDAPAPAPSHRPGSGVTSGHLMFPAPNAGVDLAFHGRTNRMGSHPVRRRGPKTDPVSTRTDLPTNPFSFDRTSQNLYGSVQKTGQESPSGAVVRRVSSPGDDGTNPATVSSVSRSAARDDPPPGNRSPP